MARFTWRLRLVISGAWSFTFRGGGSGGVGSFSTGGGGLMALGGLARMGAFLGGGGALGRGRGASVSFSSSYLMPMTALLAYAARDFGKMRYCRWVPG